MWIWELKLFFGSLRKQVRWPPKAIFSRPTIGHSCSSTGGHFEQRWVVQLNDYARNKFRTIERLCEGWINPQLVYKAYHVVITKKFVFKLFMKRTPTRQTIACPPPVLGDHSKAEVPAPNAPSKVSVGSVICTAHSRRHDPPFSGTGSWKLEVGSWISQLFAGH